MNQPAGLFDSVDVKLRSRRTDPETSREAVAKVVESGAVEYDRERIWKAIQKIQGNFTAKELAKESEIDYYTIHRRLRRDVAMKYPIREVPDGFDENDKTKPLKRDGCTVWERY